MAEIVNNNSSNRDIVNYQVSGAEKKLYHSSKTPRDGYKRIELESGKLTYHRYLDGLSGKVTYLDVRETEFGKRLGIILKDEEQDSSISLPLDTPAYRCFIEAIYNVDFSKEIAVKFYPKEDKNKKVWQNCFAYYTQEKYVDEKDGKEKNKIPQRLEVDERPNGKQRSNGKWDFSDQEDWYFSKIQETIARFEKFKANKDSQPKAEVKNDKPKGKEISDDEDLDFD